jgi:phosphohistidine phosphatase
MRTLLLMRHAKSSWKDASLPDEERPLNKRGKSAADLMGKFLRDRKFVPDTILSSTAKRARQTAKRLKKSGKFDASILAVPSLYFQGSRAYLREIASLDSTLETVLVIGHNPDLESLAARIAGKHVDLPTATIARISIKGGDWSTVLDAKGLTLEEVYRPKELDAPASRRTDRRRPRRRPSS